MTNYNQRSKFGGGRNRTGGRDGRQGGEMYKAICADCGKTCQVPFKPNGKKPVYCNDCFARNGGQVTPREFSKKSYAPDTRSFTPVQRPIAEPKKNDDQQIKLLESLNAKFDKMISLIERMNTQSELSKSVQEAIMPEEKAKPKKVSKTKKTK